MKKNTLLIIILIALLAISCSRQPEIEIDPLPSIEYQEIDIVPFTPSKTWNDKDWAIIGDALRYQITVPEALETKLQRDDREVWKQMVQFMEQSQVERREGMVMTSVQIGEIEACEPPGAAFSLQQRAQIQLTLQAHRNVLWRMGRLEMASRGVSSSIRNFLQMFSNTKNADPAIRQPLRTMQLQIQAMREEHKAPAGIWMPGDLHFRAARTTHPESIYFYARNQFELWSQTVERSERWAYLESSARPVIDAMTEWIDEFEALVRAYKVVASSYQTLERSFSPPHALVAWPCIGHNLKRMRIISELYGNVVSMQWNLSQAMDKARHTYARLQSPDYASINHDYMCGEIEAFLEQVETQKSKLSKSEDLLLAAWDETSNVIWHGMPDFIDPIHHHSLPAVESADTWNSLYREIKNELAALSAKTEAEPEQPLKNGKPRPAYISSVLETLHAPARIDEGEKSLLAISELEAHMVSIRDELLRLCMQGGCQSFPEAELANSPRKNAWIVTWRQSPTNERTLGHTLVVVKLCQLHLSRLVQRLAEIYAWFAETSNADLSWKKMKAWQRIWTLYAEQNGTYASFLKSVAAFDNNISKMGKPAKQRAMSETLEALLKLQDRFFDLTLDYARFIDARKKPPVSFDELISTWEALDAQLTAIEKVTIERDMIAHPELNTGRKKKTVDIPR